MSDKFTSRTAHARIPTLPQRKTEYRDRHVNGYEKAKKLPRRRRHNPVPFRRSPQFHATDAAIGPRGPIDKLARVASPNVVLPTQATLKVMFEDCCCPSRNRCGALFLLAGASTKTYRLAMVLRYTPSPSKDLTRDFVALRPFSLSLSPHLSSKFSLWWLPRALFPVLSDFSRQVWYLVFSLGLSQVIHTPFILFPLLRPTKSATRYLEPYLRLGSTSRLSCMVFGVGSRKYSTEKVPLRNLRLAFPHHGPFAQIARPSRVARPRFEEAGLSIFRVAHPSSSEGSSSNLPRSARPR